MTMGAGNPNGLMSSKSDKHIYSQYNKWKGHTSGIGVDEECLTEEP